MREAYSREMGVSIGEIGELDFSDVMRDLKQRLHSLMGGGLRYFGQGTRSNIAQ